MLPTGAVVARCAIFINNDLINQKWIYLRREYRFLDFGLLLNIKSALCPMYDADLQGDSSRECALKMEHKNKFPLFGTENSAKFASLALNSESKGPVRHGKSLKYSKYRT